MQTLNQLDAWSSNKALSWKSNNQLAQEVVNDTSIKTLQITEDAWIEQEKTNDKRLIKEYYDNRISDEIRFINSIITSDSSLEDVFLVNDKWEIVVRNDSSLLKWHFPWKELNMWVLLIKLYENITWIRLDLWDKIESFKEQIVPWSKVNVKDDWIYLNWKIAMSIGDYTNNTTEILQHELPKLSSDIEPSLFLPHSDPILLAKSSTINHQSNKELNKWDTITWEINPKFIDKNWNMDRHFLTEWAAQVLSSWVSYILNGWETLETKWWDFNILTFSTLNTTNFDIPKENIWDKIFVEATTINVDKREIKASYVIKDNKWNILQTWIIWWTKISMKTLDRSLDKANTIIEKETLINKAKKLLKTDFTESTFSIDRNWNLKIKIWNYKLLQAFYSGLYDISIGDLNKENSFWLKKWDEVEIRLDGFYKDWKEVMKSAETRLKEDPKLSNIFEIHNDTIRLINLPDEKNTINWKHILDLLTELQTLINQTSVNTDTWEYNTHIINNLYNPDNLLKLDENWIYTAENDEKRYFFTNEILNGINELKISKYINAWWKNEIVIKNINESDYWLKINMSLSLLFRKLYSKILNIEFDTNLNLLPGDRITLKEDWLYKDWKNICWVK